MSTGGGAEGGVGCWKSALGWGCACDVGLGWLSFHLAHPTAFPHSYAGHGAGARLLDGQTISQLQCRAVALLFGCSSAALAVRGSLEGTGIVLKYIMAGW